MSVRHICHTSCNACVNICYIYATYVTWWHICHQCYCTYVKHICMFHIICFMSCKVNAKYMLHICNICGMVAYMSSIVAYTIEAYMSV